MSLIESLDVSPLDVSLVRSSAGCTAADGAQAAYEQIVRGIQKSFSELERDEVERWKAMIRREAPGMDADNTVILFHVSARKAVTSAYPFLPKFVMFSPALRKTEMLFVAMKDIHKWAVFDAGRDIAPLSRTIYQPDSGVQT